MQVRQNELEIPYIVRQNPCTFVPCVVLTVRRVILVPAPCRRNANVGVSALIRPENSLQETALGRHEVCLDSDQAFTNKLKSTMQPYNNQYIIHQFTN